MRFYNAHNSVSTYTYLIYGGGGITESHHVPPDPPSLSLSSPSLPLLMVSSSGGEGEQGKAPPIKFKILTLVKLSIIICDRI